MSLLTIALTSMHLVAAVPIDQIAVPVDPTDPVDPGSWVEPVDPVDPDPVDPDPPVIAADINQYIFGHSLINHASGNANTVVPYWLDQFATAAGTSYSMSGRFGQLEQHVENLPPEPTWPWRFPTITPGFPNNSGTFADADFNSVMITPANFIQRLDPNDPIYVLPESAVEYTLTIIDWAVATEPDVTIHIYEHWPDMRRVIDDDVFPPTAAEFEDYHALMLGEHKTWFNDYVAALQAARPAITIELIPVGSKLTELLTTTPLSAIPATDLYEDIAPHGLPTIYFLSALVTYHHLYGEVPPSDFTVPASVHPLVADNFTAILDTIIGTSEARLQDHPVYIAAYELGVNGEGCPRITETPDNLDTLIEQNAFAWGFANGVWACQP